MDFRFALFRHHERFLYFGRFDAFTRATSGSMTPATPIRSELVMDARTMYRWGALPMK
jgi:hypothetical protein